MTHSRLSRVIRRVRHTLTEMDAAQRIVLEQRTGIPFRRAPNPSLAELEALYALEHPELAKR